MKKTILLVLFLMLCTYIYPQQKAILKPNGELQLVNDLSNDVIKLKWKQQKKKLPNGLLHLTCPDRVDTLIYDFFSNPGVNFGVLSDDYVSQYFVAPADIKINGFGFLTYEWGGFFGNGNPLLEVKIVKVNLTEEEIRSFNSPIRFGYYPAEGNTPNPISAFIDDPETTGEWIDVSDSGISEPFGHDIWSEYGSGQIIEPIENHWHWSNTDILEIPIINAREIFAVVIKNVSPYNEENYESSAIGIYGDSRNGPPLMKFYSNGRLTSNDYGWWIRPAYNLDVRVAIEIISDIPPLIRVINSTIAILPGTEYTFCAEVLDCNPIGGEIGVSEVWFKYKLPGNDFYDSLQMNLSDEYYCVTVPYMELSEPGEVKYHVSATDVNGNTRNSMEYSYSNFVPSTDNLLLFNGFDNPDGYPQDYYFGKDDFINNIPANWEHDVWAYGPLTQEVLSHYTNVIEITTGGPSDINSDVIKEWLEADPNHNYMLAGDEWLGAQTGWEDTDYLPGDFHYDILGIDADHQDLVTSSQDSSYMIAVEGSTLGDALFGKQQEIEGADSLFYNPNYEISISNWIDGVDFLPDVDVFMQTVFEDSLYNVGGSRELDAGNKIAFFAYDPLSINSAPDYYWFGFSASAPQVEALRWFGIDVVTTTRIETDEVVEHFSLSQNYPNPFNPATIIEFTIPIVERDLSRSDGSELKSALQTKLIVYDVLGREIKTLINKPMQPGKYKVEFDASELSSGVYFYTLSSGEFIQTKKFLLLK